MKTVARVDLVTFGVLVLYLLMAWFFGCGPARYAISEDGPHAYVTERVAASRRDNFNECESMALTAVNPTNHDELVRIECGLSIMSYMDFEPGERAMDVCLPKKTASVYAECFESQLDGRPPCVVVREEVSSCK